MAGDYQAAVSPKQWFAAPVAPEEDMAPVLRAAEAAGAVLKTYPGYLALLENEKPDVAVVNPPFHLTTTVVRECLDRGIHVLAEKPLATTHVDLKAIRALCERPGCPRLMGMFTMRYAPEFLAGQRFTATGAIGKPVLITVQKSYPIQGWDGGARPGFYRKRSTYGGTIPWIGIHAIDLFRWFSGSRFTEVLAAHTRLGNRDHGEMESAAVLQFQFASGALASAQLDFLRELGPGPWGDDRLRLAGEEGVLEIRGGQAVAYLPAEGRRELTLEPAPAFFPAFLDWVEKGEPMLLSTEDCLAAAEAALLARDAADQGKALAF